MMEACSRDRGGFDGLAWEKSQAARLRVQLPVTTKCGVEAVNAEGSRVWRLQYLLATVPSHAILNMCMPFRH